MQMKIGSGIPFVGKAGQLMDKAFVGLGINREEVYIANIVKCRPPQNRNPELDEAKACMDYLRTQVMLVKPKIITWKRCTKKHIRWRLWNYICKGKMDRKKWNNVYSNLASCSTFEG